MLIISKNVKLSENDIVNLSKKQLVISNVSTAYGTDDAYISIEKVINDKNDKFN